MWGYGRTYQALACSEDAWAHLVEENEGPTIWRFGGRKRASDFEPTEVAGSRMMMVSLTLDSQS